MLYCPIVFGETSENAGLSQSVALLVNRPHRFQKVVLLLGHYRFVLSGIAFLGPYSTFPVLWQKCCAVPKFLWLRTQGSGTVHTFAVLIYGEKVPSPQIDAYAGK